MRSYMYVCRRKNPRPRKNPRLSPPTFPGRLQKTSEKPATSTLTYAFLLRDLENKSATSASYRRLSSSKHLGNTRDLHVYLCVFTPWPRKKIRDRGKKLTISPFKPAQTKSKLDVFLSKKIKIITKKNVRRKFSPKKS